jgi:CMP-N,N'-diacetyllegionaminic acid synthase
MIVAIILARGGSKGVPKKNLRPLGTKPLVVWTIEQAHAARCVDETIVSTDDPAIAEVARAAGAEVIERPAELATDTASSESGIAHVLTELEGRGRQVQHVVFLQCTSPLREPDDIDRAFATYRESAADSLLSVTRSHAFLWSEGEDQFARALNYDPQRRPRRQDRRPEYRENGSIYIFSRETFARFQNRLGERIAMHVMDDATAWEIDSESDFRVLEALIEARVLARERDTARREG